MVNDDERVQRYAEAIRTAVAELSEETRAEDWLEEARAVMAVADAELAEQRAHAVRLRDARDSWIAIAEQHHDARQAAERALADERAKVARVEALAASERALAEKLRANGLGNAAAVHDTVAIDIDRALAGPEPEATGGGGL